MFHLGPPPVQTQDPPTDCPAADHKHLSNMGQVRYIDFIYRLWFNAVYWEPMGFVHEHQGSVV